MREQSSTQLNRGYRAPPYKPWLVLPNPPRNPQTLVDQARAARGRIVPQQRLTDNLGAALRDFYAPSFTEPLPPALARLAQSFVERAARD
jgi:hypothetical protein